jgi:translocator protein
MSTVSAVSISLLICVVAAALEGLFAGKNVKSFLAKLKTPRFAPPLRLWAIIGIFYYAVCFVILFRLFRYNDNIVVRYAALSLLLAVMAVNAFWNYVFFRLRNFLYSFVLGVFYSFLAIALFICLLRFDYIAAIAETPYLLYLTYAFYWGYGLLKLNRK